MAKTIFIIGADSTIGRALSHAATSQGYNVIGSTRRRADGPLLHIDLEDPGLEHIPLPKADVAFFCAAMAGFADCRNNMSRARQINVTGPDLLARRLVAQGTRVVALSSSSVFDWSMPLVPASKAPCPVSVYGKLKAENEVSFLALGEAATVVRFAKVLSADSKLFAGWLKALKRGQPITAFSDLRMAPVALYDAVALLLKVASAGTSGIYQYSARNDISYLEAARHFARMLHVSPALVRESAARDSGIPPEEITTFSSMESSRAESLLGAKAPDAFDALDRVYALPSAMKARHGAAV